MTDDLISLIAHQITGCNGSVCCHKTGGRGGEHMRPGCECRETATAIIAAIEPAIRANERAAIAPAIRAAALEEAATYIECGCPQRAGVAELAHNSAARWRLCGNDPCSAIDAAAIRALITDPPSNP